MPKLKKSSTATTNDSATVGYEAQLWQMAGALRGSMDVAEDTLRELATAHGKQVATHLYGQEINSETCAICKAGLLLKGDGDAADNIVGGPEHSTLANDSFPSREFDFMLSNLGHGYHGVGL